jgi:protein-tyrosine kinase
VSQPFFSRDPRATVTLVEPNNDTQPANYAGGVPPHTSTPPVFTVPPAPAAVEPVVESKPAPSHADPVFLSHTHLSREKLDLIEHTMRISGLSFTDSALHLGLLTQHEIERAVASTLSQLAVEQPSLIEAALRKASSGRDLVLRQGPPVKPGSRLLSVLDHSSTRGEQIRALRTQLLLMSEASRTATSIAILSPRSGDGRSQLAAELALSFAQLGKRTLLVDADMRRPTLQNLFNCIPEAGLADSIASDSAPHLHPVQDLPDMKFLAAGHTLRTNPLELLSDNRFARIMQSWQNNYAFIVLDTPPIAEYADALAIATLAGRALIIGRAKHTTYKDLRSMMRRLAITQTRVMGAVLNKF